MNSYRCLLTSLPLLGLLACSSIAPTITHQHTLTEYQAYHGGKKSHLPSLFITYPESVTGFQTDQMLYRQTPYETKAFVHHAWSNAPHDMLYPLLVQAFEDTHAFKLLGSGSHAQMADYRLDTQILELIQDFTHQPSHIEFKVKVMITESNSGKLLANKIFKLSQRTQANTPIAGAAAANHATARLTQLITRYTITVLQHRPPIKNPLD